MDTPRLLYITDPLCLWCYGISSVIEEFSLHLPKTLTIETINGGLFPAEQAKQCSPDFIAYLKKAAVQVTALSGKKFSPDFWTLLATPNFKYDTEPSTKAAVTIKNMAGEQAMLKYLHALQEAFFIEGKNIMQARTLAILAEPFGISSSEFLDFYSSESCLNLTKQEYAEAKQLGIQGFPALIYLKGRQGYKLSAGFSTLENLKTALQWAENECNPVSVANKNVCSDEGCSV
jgi:putative protein-disulfide isomerase